MMIHILKAVSFFYAVAAFFLVVTLRFKLETGVHAYEVIGNVVMENIIMNNVHKFYFSISFI